MRLNWETHKYDGANYSFTDAILEVEIRIELAHGGYNVALYNLEGHLLRDRINTEIYEENEMLQHHFALNMALRIANNIYKELWIDFYDRQTAQNEKIHNSEKGWPIS